MTLQPDQLAFDLQQSTCSVSAAAGWDTTYLMQNVASFFATDAFMPHGHCYLWRPEILWLHIISDVLIGLSYFSIPIALFVFARRRKDLEFKWVFYLFTAFIMLCGATHILNIVIIWNPIYGIEGILKLITAIVSAVTAAGLWPLIPKALSLPNPRHYLEQNKQLQSEIRSRREAETKLRLLSERLALATDIGQVGVWEIEPADGSVSWDDTMAGIYGIKPSDFEGHFKDWTRRILPDDVPMVKTLIENMRQHGRDFETQFRIQRPDGSVRHIRAAGRRVGADADSRVIGVNYDITEDVAIREILWHKTEEAERASRIKSEFLANMSHEIRTPLNGILGGCQVLQRQNKDPNLEEWLNIISTSGRSLMGVINDVLDISKIETGLLTLEYEDIEVGELVEEALNTIRGVAEEKGIFLQAHLDDVANVTVRADRGRLRQILVNLLGNAVKFTERGAIELHAVIIKDEIPFVRFEIKDTGPGIPDDKLEVIFERFRQVDGSQTRRHGGTGLGLAISKDLAELMGGRLGVRSKIGVGSTFYADVPLSSAGHAISSTNGSIEGSAQKIDLVSSGGQYARSKILVVEDNAMNRKVVAEFLKPLSTQIETAENGLEALERIHAQPFDLIIMDIQMPVMNGDEAIRRIRSSGQDYADIPIIVLTANALSGAKDRYLQIGANDYLSKPVDADALREMVERFLNKSPSVT